MEKQIKIDIPEGYEIDREKSTFECIKFKPLSKIFPKWEELGEVNGFYIDTCSNIHGTIYSKSNEKQHKNVYPTEKLAEAALAQSQLLQLRDYVRKGWVPDWKDGSTKYTIEIYQDKYKMFERLSVPALFSFKEREQVKGFLENYRDLLEEYKPLLLS